ncbi:MAG: DUF736 family protein [Candidatus Aenigmatarchaeota archaeon]
MVGKRPDFRLVVEKNTIGSLWKNTTKEQGKEYYSGTLDISLLRKMLQDKAVQVETVGKKELVRIAMFGADFSADKQQENKQEQKFL